MSFVYDTFDDLSLPRLSLKQDIGIGKARTKPQPLAGGSTFDPLGSANARRAFGTFQVSGTFVGTAAEVHAMDLAIRAKYGVRSQLWRRGVGDTTQQHWCHARLIAMNLGADTESRVILPITLTFEMWSPVWYGVGHGPAWTFDSGYSFDSGLWFDSGDSAFTLGTAPLGSSGSTITLQNDGHAYVSNCVVTATAGSAALTLLTITNLTTQTEWTYDTSRAGALAVSAGQTLEVRCGSKRVAVNGTTNWAGWTRSGTNTLVDWLRLVPGTNSIKVAWTGGGTGATLVFTYADGWN